MIKSLPAVSVHSIEAGFNPNPETNAVILLNPCISFEVDQSRAMGGK